MIIDISSYNGNIDFDTLIRENDIERVIMRSTTKNGEPDTALAVNYQKLLNASRVGGKRIPVDFYKFTYATDFSTAYIEAFEMCMILRQMCLLHSADRIFLDLEPVNGKNHTKDQVRAIITAYFNVLDSFDLEMGIYCSWGYLSLIPGFARDLPIWVARWSNALGDVDGYNVVLWQYSDKGNVKGINGAVDLSRYV